MGDDLNQFELLGLIHGNRKATKRLIHILFVVILLLIAGLIYLANKPPLVIRIDKLGNSDAVADYTQETATPSDDDVRNFSKKFLDDYIALKSNLVVRQFETSLNMMTPELAKEHLKAMKEQNTVGIVQAAGIRNDLSIGDIHAETVGDEYYVKVKATLETRPVDDLSAAPKIKPVVTTLVLQVAPRTADHPYALIVKEVQVSVDHAGVQIENNLGEVTSDAPHE